MTRNDFLSLALGWVKTPYHHQARLKAVGSDCIGFILGVIEEATGTRVDVPSNYGRYPDPPAALALIEKLGLTAPVPVWDAKPADVLYMRVARDPQHFGLVSLGGKLLHCVEPVGVVEVTLNDKFMRRVFRAWHLKFIED